MLIVTISATCIMHGLIECNKKYHIQYADVISSI